MGMMMLPPVVVSLPFKLIFFVLVDAWSLVAGSLIHMQTSDLPIDVIFIRAERPTLKPVADRVGAELCLFGHRQGAELF